MILNKTKSKIRRSLGGGGLNPSFLCAFAPLRDKICEILRNPRLKMGKPALSQNLFLRNEPNFNHSNIIVISCITVVYNAFQTKTKNGTNPNEPNFFTTPKPLFSAELFSCRRSAEGGLARRPVGVVLFTNTKKSVESPVFQKNLFSRNEPNFRKEDYTLTHEITRNYNRSHRNHHPKNEPNTNPIRTQYEPNSNPIRTQSKAKQTQSAVHVSWRNPLLQKPAIYQHGGYMPIGHQL